MEGSIVIRPRDRSNDSVLSDNLQIIAREPEVTFFERAGENITGRPIANRRASTRNRRPTERYGISVSDY